MKDARGATGSVPSVCPFVALLEDRDRRADGPDPRNRCYASPAPRQREIAYQAEYCYTDRFSTCAAFLDWAARNAAEPSYPVPGIEAARAAEARRPGSAPAASGSQPASGAGAAGTTGAGGVTGAAGPDLGDDAADATSEAGGVPRAGSPTETMDWVSASAWAAFPTAAVEELDEDEPGDEGEEPAPADDGGAPERDEATTAPRVPAALPMRRRRRPLEPIRTRGSGEWFYSDPPDREPLVRRRFAAIPPVVLGVVGLLVAALVVLLIPSLLAGGGGDPGIAGRPSQSPGASVRRPATPRPSAASTADASVVPATPEPRAERTYRVRTGDSLSRIAARFDVGMELLQCRNLIRNPNLITLGQAITIPPEGYACAPGWRRATPTPVPPGSPESDADGTAVESPGASPAA